MESGQSPNLVFKPQLLKNAIQYSHTADQPTKFDLTIPIQRFADDMSEALRVGAMMIRDISDNLKIQERVYRMALN